MTEPEWLEEHEVLAIHEGVLSCSRSWSPTATGTFMPFAGASTCHA